MAYLRQPLLNTWLLAVVAVVDMVFPRLARGLCRERAEALEDIEQHQDLLFLKARHTRLRLAEAALEGTIQPEEA